MTDSILQEAQRLVYGDRGEDYGPPDENFARTVDIFRAMTGHDLTPHEGVLFMVAVKLARIATCPRKRDNYVDGAGYIDCAWEALDPPAEFLPINVRQGDPHG